MIGGTTIKLKPFLAKGRQGPQYIRVRLRSDDAPESFKKSSERQSSAHAVSSRRRHTMAEQRNTRGELFMSIQFTESLIGKPATAGMLDRLKASTSIVVTGLVSNDHTRTHTHTTTRACYWSYSEPNNTLTHTTFV